MQIIYLKACEILTKNLTKYRTLMLTIYIFVFHINYVFFQYGNTRKLQLGSSLFKYLES